MKNKPNATPERKKMQHHVLVVQWLNLTWEVMGSSAAGRWLSWGIFGSNTEKPANVCPLVGFTWSDHQPSSMLRWAPRLSSGGRSLMLVGSSQGSGYQGHKKKTQHQMTYGLWNYFKQGYITPSLHAVSAGYVVWEVKKRRRSFCFKFNSRNFSMQGIEPYRYETKYLVW